MADLFFQIWFGVTFGLLLVYAVYSAAMWVLRLKDTLQNWRWTADFLHADLKKLKQQAAGTDAFLALVEDRVAKLERRD